MSTPDAPTDRKDAGGVWTCASDRSCRAGFRRLQGCLEDCGQDQASGSHRDRVDDEDAFYPRSRDRDHLYDTMPPHVPNEDGGGCVHCHRELSPKWLLGPNRTWYCTGEASKSQCRTKAKAVGATVWIPSVQMLPGMIMQRSASRMPGWVQVESLRRLVRTARSRNDTRLMSLTLAHATQLGLALSELGEPFSTAAVATSAIPPHMLKILHADGERALCVIKNGAAVVGPSQYYVTPRMESEWGITAAGLYNAASLESYFTTLMMDPEDARSLLREHVNVVESLLRSTPPGVWAQVIGRGTNRCAHAALHRAPTPLCARSCELRLVPAR
jgi:hypothetical protein